MLFKIVQVLIYMYILQLIVGFSYDNIIPKGNQNPTETLSCQKQKCCHTESWRQ